MSSRPGVLAPVAGTPELRQFATFYIDGFCFGVNVLDVQEVLFTQEITPVPLAHSVIEGLINLRGQIVTAVDMRRRLQFSPRKEGELPMNLVIQDKNSHVSLLVDRIGDVIEVDSTSRERPPDNLSEVAKKVIQAVYTLPDKLLLVLDTQQVLSAEDWQDTVVEH